MCQRTKHYATMVQHLQHHPPEGWDELDETWKPPRKVLLGLCEDAKAADTQLAHHALKLLGYFVALKPFSDICGEEDVDLVLQMLVSLALTTDRKSILNLAVWCLSVQTFEKDKVKKVFPSVIEALIYGINNPFDSSSASLESLKAIERLAGSMPEIVRDHHVWIMPATCLLFEDNEAVAGKALDCLECAVRLFEDAGPPPELSKCLADCVAKRNMIFAMESDISRGSTIALHAVRVWGAVIVLSGCMLECTDYVNKMLKVLEKCFGSKDSVLYAEAFQAWQSLIVGLASQKMLSSRKHLALLTQPILLGLKSSRKPINQAAFQCWIHLVHKLDGHLLEGCAFQVAVLPVLNMLEDASSLSSALGTFSNTVCKSRDSPGRIQKDLVAQDKNAESIENGQGCENGPENEVFTQVVRHTKRLLSMPGAACSENMNDLLEFLESPHLHPAAKLGQDEEGCALPQQPYQVPTHCDGDRPKGAAATVRDVPKPSSTPVEEVEVEERFACADLRAKTNHGQRALKENQLLAHSHQAAQEKDRDFAIRNEACNKRRKSVHFDDTPLIEKPTNSRQTCKEMFNTQDGALAIVDISRGNGCTAGIGDTKDIPTCLCREMEFCDESIDVLFAHTTLPPQCKELVHNWGLQEIGQLASCPTHLLSTDLAEHFRTAFAQFSKSWKYKQSGTPPGTRPPSYDRSKNGRILNSLCSILDAPMWQHLDRDNLVAALSYTSHFQTKICNILRNVSE